MGYNVHSWAKALASPGVAKPLHIYNMPCPSIDYIIMICMLTLPDQSNIASYIHTKLEGSGPPKNFEN